ETLKVIVPFRMEDEIRERWMRYRQYAFFRAPDQRRLILHPVVRDLLLKRLRSLLGDYKRTHAHLRAYFADAASSGEQEGQVEEAYHALALGDPEPAIQVALFALRG